MQPACRGASLRRSPSDEPYLEPRDDERAERAREGITISGPRVARDRTV